MSYLIPEKSKQDKPRGSQAFIVLLPDGLALNGYLSYSDPVSLLTYLTINTGNTGCQHPFTEKGALEVDGTVTQSTQVDWLNLPNHEQQLSSCSFYLLPDMKQTAAFII